MATEKTEKKTPDPGVTKTIYLSGPQARQIDQMGRGGMAKVIKAGLAALAPGAVDQKVTITLNADGTYTKSGALS